MVISLSWADDKLDLPTLNLENVELYEENIYVIIESSISGLSVDIEENLENDILDIEGGNLATSGKYGSDFFCTRLR